MSRIVVKVGGAVAAQSAARRARARRRENEVCVVHGAGPQISAEMERAGIPVEFVGGRRVTTPRRARGRARVASPRSTRRCARRSASARVPLFGDEIGLQARRRCRRSASSATRCRRSPRRSSPALEAGAIPVVAPLAAGPLNVNADEAAAAIAFGHRRRPAALPDRRRRASSSTARSSTRSTSTPRPSCSTAGTLEGGIIPKLARRRHGRAQRRPGLDRRERRWSA